MCSRTLGILMSHWPASPNLKAITARQCVADNSYRLVGFAGGGVTVELWLDLLGFAFVGLVLVEIPLSLGKLPFASRVLVMPWAKTGVAERTMIPRAVFIFILLFLIVLRLMNLKSKKRNC